MHDFLRRKKSEAETAVPTFKEMLAAYVARREAPESQQRNVEWVARRYFSAWNHRPIDSITIDDVLTVKNACGAKHYMANRCVEFVRAIFNWSAETIDNKVNFWRVGNPAKDISFHDEETRDRYLLPEELRRFNEQLQKEQHTDLADLLTLCLGTAARKGDILSMCWRDIDWHRLTWRVPDPKNGEPYDVPLTPAVVHVLETRRDRAPDDATFVFPGMGADGHLDDVPKRQWKRFRKLAKIEDITIHDLRRTKATYAALHGVPLQHIAAMLGHSDKNLQSVTVYAKLKDSAVREAAEASERKMLEEVSKASVIAEKQATRRRLRAA
jgi:integrase